MQSLTCSLFQNMMRYIRISTQYKGKFAVNLKGKYKRKYDEVAEWLRRWTANPLCSARVGSNPILVERHSFCSSHDYPQ
uniref:Uncharacterized protein n=1 Tax=Anguilla anguilla TaxID=7936 RepID=A0A0E9W6A8_ANGAN